MKGSNTDYVKEIRSKIQGLAVAISGCATANDMKAVLDFADRLAEIELVARKLEKKNL